MGYSIEGVVETKRMIRRIQRRHRQLRPFLTSEARRMEQMIARSWARRQSPNGEPWEPYKDPTRDGGSVRERQLIAARSKRLVVRGDYITAFHWYGTEFMPPRNPSPILRFMGQTGPDPAWVAIHTARLREYILSGDTSGSGASNGR